MRSTPYPKSTKPRLVWGGSRPQRLHIALIGLGSLLLLLFVVGELIYLNRSQERDRLLMEFAVSRAASALTEAHLEGQALTDAQLPEGVTAFGIYTARGEPELLLGDAPSSLPRGINLPYSLTLSGNTLRLLRPVGGELPPDSRRMGQGRRMPMMGSMMPAPSGGALRVSYTAYDVSAIQSRSRQLLFFIILALATTALLFVLLMTIARRLQRAEARVQETRRLAELGEAARTLTHEIRNPLGALKMQASLLRRTLPPDQSEAVELLDEEIGRISYLVDRVREFLKNPKGKPEQLELNEFIRGLRLGDDVEKEESPEPLTVRIDREKLRSAVENLVTNGREASREAGNHSPVLLSIYRQNDGAKILVCDRGPEF